MPIKMIVAVDECFGIGKDNKMPWNIRCDMNYFSKLTKGTGRNAIVMGRNTYESIGRPLPNRRNIVLTKNENYEVTNPNIWIYNDIATMIKYLNSEAFFEDIWIIGGAAIYQEFLNMGIINEIYITHVSGNYDCDTFFPNISNHYVEDILYRHKGASENKSVLFTKYTL
tara:strand:+ start:4846 stop:5352 length:507 start_codon:yes stop_codon:yes gene_type:complete